MVREFQSVIGREAREQIREQTGGLPDAAVACVGGGSNAMGLFYPFIDDDVRLIGVEAAGEGLDGRNAATLSKGSPGVLHGAMSYLLQDTAGQVELAHSLRGRHHRPGALSRAHGQRIRQGGGRL